MIKLHLGCGWRDFGSDWIHIDRGDYSHLQHKSITDLSQFDNESVDVIYASHVIEYFDRDEFKNVLCEWRRVLKIGATLRLAVPDFESMSRLYNDNKITLQDIIGPLYGKMLMGEQTIYHKMVYDYSTLKDLLLECDMRNVRLYDWQKTEHCNFDDHSQAYIPHMDKQNGTLISLNIECDK